MKDSCSDILVRLMSKMDSQLPTKSLKSKAPILFLLSVLFHLSLACSDTHHHSIYSDYSSTDFDCIVLFGCFDLDIEILCTIWPVDLSFHSSCSRNHETMPSLSYF